MAAYQNIIRSHPKMTNEKSNKIRTTKCKMQNAKYQCPMRNAQRTM